MRQGLPRRRLWSLYASMWEASQDLVSRCPHTIHLLLLILASLPELHPCTQLCHAPSSCSEVEPCMSTVTLTCPCGRIKQNSPCGRSTSNPLGRAGAVAGSIKCSNECAIAKRNARLAEALGISPDKREAKGVVYSEELMNFVKANNQKFCLLVEKAFAEYVPYSSSAIRSADPAYTVS